MALGDLTPDQERFAARVTAGTGLNPVVVRSWIGSESGWGVTKATHNYLNIGPGRAYPSVDDAAQATVSLLNNSAHYTGIRSALDRGPDAQVQAIIASPWDAGHYVRGAGNLLQRTYERTASAVGALPVAIGWADEAEQLDDALGNPDWNRNLLGLDDLGRQLLVAGLGLVFTLAALALIAMGLHRLTGANPLDTFAKAAGVARVAAV